MCVFPHRVCSLVCGFFLPYVVWGVAADSKCIGLVFTNLKVHRVVSRNPEKRAAFLASEKSATPWRAENGPLVA